MTYFEGANVSEIGIGFGTNGFYELQVMNLPDI